PDPQPLPRLAPAAAVDAGLGVAVAVSPERPRAGRHEPAVCILGVDGDRPCVVAVHAIVGGLPGVAGVAAEGGTASARLVGAALGARMPGNRVHVALSARPVVLPGAAAVPRAHQATKLDACQ